MKRPTVSQACALALLAISGTGAFAAATTGSELRQLVEHKQLDEAYTRGKAAPDSMGDPEFDFFFGVAAIETERAADGVLALERYLLRKPDDNVARFLLAKGYFALREDDAAKAEFESLERNAGEPVASSSRRFIEAIAARDLRGKLQWGAFVEVATGYDDNITTGVNRGTQPMIPGFGILPSQPDNSTGVRAADVFGNFSAGYSVTVPWQESWMLYANIGAEQRLMVKSENRIFDQTLLRADGGVQVESGVDTYRLGAGVTQSWVDHRRYALTPALQAEWSRSLGSRDRLALSAQVAEPRYTDGCTYFLRDTHTDCTPNPTSQRDSRIVGVAGNLTHLGSGDWRPVYSFAASLAEERNQADLPSLTRDITGARIGLVLTPLPGHQISAGFSWQDSRYQDKYPVADVPRRDEVTAFDLSWNHALDENWVLRADASVSRQSSNIGLFNYQRNLVGIAVRRLFK